MLTVSPRDDLVKFLLFQKDNCIYRYSSSVFYLYPDSNGQHIEISRELKTNQAVRSDISYCCFRLGRNPSTQELILETTSEFDAFLISPRSLINSSIHRRATVQYQSICDFYFNFYIDL